MKPIFEVSDYEKESLIFWREVLSKIGETHFYANSLFITNFNTFNSFYKDKLVYLSSILTSTSLNFYNIDIRNPLHFDIGKKYDYIFLSNILDYYRNKEDITMALNNLLPLIKQNGSIVCCTFVDSLIAYENPESCLELEKNIFEKNFKFQPITKDYTSQYYQYIKK